MASTGAALLGWRRARPTIPWGGKTCSRRCCWRSGRRCPATCRLVRRSDADTMGRIGSPHILGGRWSSWSSLPLEQDVGDDAALGGAAQVADEWLPHTWSTCFVRHQPHQRTHGIHGGGPGERRNKLQSHGRRVRCVTDGVATRPRLECLHPAREMGVSRGALRGAYHRRDPLERRAVLVGPQSFCRCSGSRTRRVVATLRIGGGELQNGNGRRSMPVGAQVAGGSTPGGTEHHEEERQWAAHGAGSRFRGQGSRSAMRRRSATRPASDELPLGSKVPRKSVSEAAYFPFST